MKDVLIALLDGVGALGVLRIYLGAGIGAVMGGLLFYFGPSLSTALKKSDEKPKLSIQQSGSGNVQNNYIGDRETESGRLVSQAQFAKMAEVEAFFGGKEEGDLRELFDLPTILNKNIEAQIVRMRFIKAGRESEFFYSNYTDNGQWIMWAKEGHVTTGPSGVHLNAGPKDVLHLVTTAKFQLAKRRIVEFANSAFVPESVKVQIKSFDAVIDRDTELMIRVLDERMHEDENYFFLYLDMQSRYYGVIVSDFATRVEHLKPPAEQILLAVAASWKISGK